MKSTLISCSLIIITVLLGTNCKTKYNLILAPSDPGDTVSAIESEEIRAIPLSQEKPFSTRSIRTSFHFFNGPDSSLNYSPLQGRSVVDQLLESANFRLLKNDKMHLPEGNDTEVFDTKIRYELSVVKGQPGIFYHYHDPPQFFIKKGNNANRYDRDIIGKYAVSHDSVLNVFLMPFDPAQLSSGDQKNELTAIALGHMIKIPGMYQSGRKPGDYAGILNHELGHVFGLRHSWDNNDGCADTPLHDNCWNRESSSPCDGPTSNNIMDYNAFQSAITPCQIAKIHSAIANPGRSVNRIVIPNWCDYYGAEQITVSHKKRWSSPIQVSRDIIIREGGMLYITSLVHLAPGVKIRIEKGGSLILEGATLYNSCGRSWGGIYCHPKGRFISMGDRNLISDIVSDTGSYRPS